MFISANGVQGDWDQMLAEFAEDTVSVIVERPSERVVRGGTQWVVDMTKEEGEKIGANLVSSSECRSMTALCVSAINFGPLAAFNILHQGTAVEVPHLLPPLALRVCATSLIHCTRSPAFLPFSAWMICYSEEVFTP